MGFDGYLGCGSVGVAVDQFGGIQTITHISYLQTSVNNVGDFSILASGLCFKASLDPAVTLIYQRGTA